MTDAWSFNGGMNLHGLKVLSRLIAFRFGLLLRLACLCAAIAGVAFDTVSAQEVQPVEPAMVEGIGEPLDPEMNNKEFSLRLVRLTRRELAELAKSWLNITQQQIKEAARINIKLSTAKGPTADWIILGVGFVIVISFFGINVTPMLALFGGASFIIGFATQSTLSNLASGLLLMCGDQLKPLPRSFCQLSTALVLRSRTSLSKGCRNRPRASRHCKPNCKPTIQHGVSPDITSQDREAKNYRIEAYG